MIQGRGPKVRRERGRRFVVKPKVCTFCTEKKEIDYKDFAMLRRYVSERGKIEPRRRTGVCGKHQRRLAMAIKRARFIALLPATPIHSRQLGLSGGAHERHIRESQSAETNIPAEKD
ncbi:MAG TPA: 30S ribosomal protein S18 [Dehalococcoidia bacterium]|nr:30S ribosomal protein S18 [Dehalococcoidia bacterium]